MKKTKTQPNRIRKVAVIEDRHYAITKVGEYLPISPDEYTELRKELFDITGDGLIIVEPKLLERFNKLLQVDITTGVYDEDTALLEYVHEKLDEWLKDYEDEYEEKKQIIAS